MNSRTKLQRVTDEGKSDEWCKLAGGFVVAQLSNGDIDYFKIGQPPHIHGERDSGAKILTKHRWNHVRWSRID